ncbi:hypothetical protein [Dactylosporangium sp. CA-092794]|uniref:hypothetical protein n=1 Tax=Dactylosporangium sp. CA-092794 TaxID=3239929 RepID=UPI003D92B6B1
MITIPAGQVAAGHLPPVCPRHGEAPIESKRIKLISKPPSWAPVLILVGVITYAIVVAVMRKKVDAPAWPWCAQCKAQRSRLLGIGWGLVGLGALLFVIGIAVMGSNDSGAMLFLLGLIVLLVGIIVAARGGYQAVTSAFVSQDGQFVEVHKPDDRFVQALQYGGQPLPQQQRY